MKDLSATITAGLAIAGVGVTVYLSGKAAIKGSEMAMIDARYRNGESYVKILYDMKLLR